MKNNVAAKMKRTVTLQQVSTILKDSKARWMEEKRQCTRFSPAWHRADACIRELLELRKDFDEVVAKGKGDV